MEQSVHATNGPTVSLKKTVIFVHSPIMIIVYFRNGAVLEPLANDQEFAFSNAWLKMIFF